MKICRTSLLIVFAFSFGVALSQSAAPPAVLQQPQVSGQHVETIPELKTALSASQQASFEEGLQLFGQGKFADARPLFDELLRAKPDDAVLSKLTAECAINTGDFIAAKRLIDTVLAANDRDWQAVGLLARLSAQSGDKSSRDTAIARVEKLHDQGIIPVQVTQYPVEHDPLPGGGSILIFQSIYPWGNYKVHNYARIFDSNGKLLSRITLESADFDQVFFAKEHPAEAAAGARRYSYDGYTTGPAQANGLISETHATYGFVDKEPAYDEMRARFLEIAAGIVKSIIGSQHKAQ